MENERKREPRQGAEVRLTALGRRELCALVGELCSLVSGQVGAAGCRGGIFPANIRREDDGRLALGPAAKSGWEGEELSFLAPELFWHGEGSPASDVYSLGLLLYYALDSGRLPFAQDGEETALKRRLNGESFAPPQAAGRRLGEIVEKATRFQASERYRSPAELKAMLDSCVANPYLSGAPCAETVFHKSEEELSEVERMMVDILAEDEKSPKPETPVEEPIEEAIEEPVEERIEEPVEEPAEEPAETPAEEPAEEPEAPAEPEKPPVVELVEEKHPELEPVVLSFTPPPAPKIAQEPFDEELAAPVTVRYDKNVERERKISAQVKRRRARPILFALVFCALLVAVAAITRYFDERDAREMTPMALPTVPPSELTPGPDQSSVPAEQVEVEIAGPVETAPPEHAYELFVEDVSWSEARARCLAKGGHLVVIQDEEEFRKITALADERGVANVWVGCARVGGVLSWETDETVSYYPWGSGEPSYKDGWDGTQEDYLLLWKQNGAWVYNDSRNDPVGDYPSVYRGRIAYVCEYDDGVIPRG